MEQVNHLAIDHLGIGTEKGAYRLDHTGGQWSVSGPLFPGWKVSALSTAPDGTYLAAIGSNWFGASVHRSNDFENWTQVEIGPKYDGDNPLGLKLNQIWTFHNAGDRVYAGVDQAGLFYSDDQGLTWEGVPAINEWPGREHWSPGFGGLTAHRILSQGDRLWVGISAVGVFRSEDCGESFVRADQGVIPASEEGEPAWCVHSLVADRDDPNRIWRQDHRGVYRTTDGGDKWEQIENGLPASFGFAIGRNQETGTLFVAPITADENRVPVNGHFSVFRSQDDGDSWEEAGVGWPQEGHFNGALRNAMVVDNQGGVAIGTTGGSVFVTSDNGDHWEQLPVSLPRILCVATI
ncbi:MAG: hypothetical protein H0T94_05655 [Acidimicrobiia bacterium]|nr:hypothetical protein [Acidimicrobiia bacterium]MDQ3501927.1 hypothetical protein [Actinomycetota bacterium]